MLIALEINDIEFESSDSIENLLIATRDLALCAQNVFIIFESIGIE